MKTIALFAALLAFSLNAVAQTSVATQQQINDFYNTTTCVVLEAGLISEYNIYIQDAAENYWKITDYEIIDFAEFERRRRNPDYSFLLKTKIKFNRDNTDANYDFMTLVIGDRCEEIADMPELANFPLSYYRVDEEKYVYKLGAIVKFIQNHVNLTKSNPQLTSENIIDHYNDNVADIEGKTLYVIQEDLDSDVNSKSEIAKHYSGKIEFISRDDMEDLIDSGDENAVFLHKVGPSSSSRKARCWKLILGVSDARLYYFDYHMINNRNGDGFLKKDFKALERQ